MLENIKKILVAYDGSECANAALDDLQQAGLPREAEAIVMSVTEYAFLPPNSDLFVSDSPEILFSQWGLAEQLAKQATCRIQSMFPNWKVTAETGLGSAASEINRLACGWSPDLLLIGSHGRTALGRFILGSVSQRVVTDAPCSVRVARHRLKEAALPLRLLLGMDGSVDAYAMVHAVAARTWPEKTEAKIVTAIGPFFHANPLLVEEEEAQARRIQ